ncbi:MAG: hypothetical protein ACI8W8_000784 [Rhodothermales bacterium]|jgi:hypothetical protein
MRTLFAIFAVLGLNALSDDAFFENEVHPILETHCFKCHGGEEVKVGFRLSNREDLLKGGELGAAIDLDAPEKSYLLEMISYKDQDHQMPPRGKLSQAERDTLKKWVMAKVPFKAELERHFEEEAHLGFDPTKVTDETKSAWAYQPVKRPEVPKAAAHPVDAFIQKQLAENGLKPNPRADRRTLVRRAYYDLTGLPPTPEEVEAFVKDESPNAWETLIDDLLSRPQYGEKWGRHWLDLVRYAESNGYERDAMKDLIWRYRDYVIRAFNQDKPYSRFITEQIAGDELEPPTADSVIATGFHRLGIWDDEPADRQLAEFEYLDDIVRTTGEVMLGMTIGCARCHSHKIDPIPIADYYKFLSFFRNISPHGKGGSNHVTVPNQMMDDAEYTKKKEQRDRQITAQHTQLQRMDTKLKKDLLIAEPELAAKLMPPSDLSNLKYKFYRDTWEKLPDFDNLRHENAGELVEQLVTLAPATRDTAYGMVYTGSINVPAEGVYNFRIEARDGLRLLVGGEELVKADGVKDHHVKTAALLKAGLQDFRLDYFNKEGGYLRIWWSGEGMPERPLFSATVRDVILETSETNPQPWHYSTNNPGDKWFEPDYDDKKWQLGNAPFGSKGTPNVNPHTKWRTPDIWLRTTVQVEELNDDITLRLYHDEDASIYVNGRLVHQVKGYQGNYYDIPLDRGKRKAFKLGLNTIAVHCKQTSGGQAIDVGFKTQPSRLTGKQLFARYGKRILGDGAVKRYNTTIRTLQYLRDKPLNQSDVKAMAVAEQGEKKTHILRRGNPNLAGDEVQPGFPSVLSPPEAVIPPRKGNSSGRRKVLAEWMTSRENPLTARVFVNRLWQHHFGRGIVRSTNDFGNSGDKPTHAELLDWLSADFMDNGWKMKRMHKLLMMSEAYQMSSRAQEAAIASDPQNDHFWRFNMRRLTAEEIRDSILATSGELNLKPGGPSFYPKLQDAVLATSSTGAGKWGKSTEDEQKRRSVYIVVRRSMIPPMLQEFDSADTDSSCAVRFSTTVPLQALTMLNSEFLNNQAEVFADRVRNEAGAKPEDQVRRVLELVYSRPASDKEVAENSKFLADFQAEEKIDANTAFERFCLVALNLNEFVYID